MTQPDTQQTYRQRVLRVMIHIGEHLDADLSLEAMARLSCFSPYHFHRIFREQAGEPLAQYVRRLRLERSACRLTQSDRSVLDIALEAGFEAHESFSRAFRERFGVTPSEYRQRRGVVMGPPPPVDTEPRPTGAMIMQVQVKQVEPKRVASIRHIGPYHEIGGAFERLCAWAGRRQAYGPDTQVLGVFYDNPEVTPPDKLRSDAAMTVGGHVQADGEVTLGELAGGEYAVVRHKGAYSKLIDTYRWVYGRWLPTSGREPADVPCFEVYLNDPKRTTEEDLETDIYVPLKA